MGEILLSADFSDYADDTEDCRMTRPFHANPRALAPKESTTWIEKSNLKKEILE